MKLSEVKEILEMLDKYVLTFLATRVGKEVLSSQDKSNLKKIGIDYKSIPSIMSTPETAFKFGLISNYISENSSKKLGFGELKKIIKTNKIIPLTQLEKDAISSLKEKMYFDVKRESEKIKSSIIDNYIPINQVSKITKKAIKGRKDSAQLSSMLKNHFDKFVKDFDAMAEYSLHTAFEHGRISGVVRTYGKDHLVFKDVYPSACSSCVKLFLTGGVGSEPKLFSIEELIANGSNIGKKRSEWKPTVSATHFFCRCSLNRVPYNFNEQEYKNGEWEYDPSIRNFIKKEKE